MARIAHAHRGSVAKSEYRYWRLYITANNADSSYTGIGECEMAITAGGLTVTSGGTASASSTLTPAGTAFDGIQNTTNGWVTYSGSAIPSWIQYDFGVGNAKVILEIRLFNQVDQYTRVPKNLTVQGSNDGSDFTDVKIVNGLVSWVNNTPKIITI